MPGVTMVHHLTHGSLNPGIRLCLAGAGAATNPVSSPMLAATNSDRNPWQCRHQRAMPS